MHLNLLVCGNEGVVEKATIGIVNLIVMLGRTMNSF